MANTNPVFRRKVRKTVDYWEYFQVDQKSLNYLAKDGVEPKTVVLDGIASYEVLEAWDEVKDPERAAVLRQGVVNSGDL